LKAAYEKAEGQTLRPSRTAMPTIGKRSTLKAGLFADELAFSIASRLQLTTNGFRPYKTEMKRAFGHGIDFAQIYKENNMLNATNKRQRAVHIVRSGTPNVKRITTAHMEHGNLTLRTWNKRFNRKTICFSKDEEYLAYSVYLFAASYNFCKAHGGLLTRNQTPAMESELTSRKWTALDLLNPSLAFEDNSL
jgi:hypothetical protein